MPNGYEVYFNGAQTENTWTFLLGTGDDVETVYKEVKVWVSQDSGAVLEVKDIGYPYT